MGHFSLFFLIFVFSIIHLVDNLRDKILPMTGFELQISGVGSDHSTNRAHNHCLVLAELPGICLDVLKIFLSCHFLAHIILLDEVSSLAHDKFKLFG